MMFSVAGKVDNRARPTIWSTEAPTQKYIGGILKALHSPGARTDPIGDAKVNGMNLTPASSGERELTICSLCGSWKMVPNHGAPRKSALLSRVSRYYRIRKRGCSCVHQHSESDSTINEPPRQDRFPGSFSPSDSILPEQQNDPRYTGNSEKRNDIC